MTDFSELFGKTIIRIDPMDSFGDELTFVTDTGHRYTQWHDQDCCEQVSIEEVIGDMEDLIGSPILLAEEVSSRDGKPDDATWKAGEYDESYTWTFYKLSTIKGSVTIRWFGSSNGYYSEGVSFRGPE
jgi:hypothetical protein